MRDLQSAQSKEAYILAQILLRYSDQCHAMEKMWSALHAANEILVRLAQESESNITEYAYHHEPLRKLAKKALPIVAGAMSEGEKWNR